MLKWLRCLFRGHKFEFVRNVYGDEIIELGCARSVWRCTHCKRYQYRKDFFTEQAPGEQG